MLTTRFLTPSAQRATWVLLVLSALMACLLTILAPAPALAQDREPLLIEGKSSLYQRVIVHPEASLYAEPSTSSGVVRNRIKPFSVFYVYARQGEGDGQWLEVGASTNGEVLGWLRLFADISYHAVGYEVEADQLDTLDQNYNFMMVRMGAGVAL